MGKKVVVCNEGFRPFAPIVAKNFGNNPKRDGEELIALVEKYNSRVVPEFGIVSIYELPNEATDFMIVSGYADCVKERLVYCVDGKIFEATEDMIVESFEDTSWER